MKNQIFHLVLYLVFIHIFITISAAPNPNQKKPVPKNEEWFKNILQLMESSNQLAWKATFHPEVVILYNRVKFPTAKFIQSFNTYKYSNCKVQYVHTKGPRGAIARWNCDFENKVTGETFPLDVTDEYDFDLATDRVTVLDRKFKPDVVEKFRKWEKQKLEL